MHRIAFLGVGVVAVLALALTAASVETGLQTVDPDPSGEEGQPRPPPERGGGQASDDAGEGNGSSQPTETDGTTEPSTTGQRSLAELLIGVVLLVVGGCAVIYGLTRGEDTSTPAESTVDSTVPDGSAQREIAVRDVPPSNDLFRTWLALQEGTYPDRDTVTPAEIRALAVQNGYPRHAVDELTTMFCAVRYSDVELTADLERRARQLGDQLGLTGENHR